MAPFPVMSIWGKAPPLAIWSLLVLLAPRLAAPKASPVTSSVGGGVGGKAPVRSLELPLKSVNSRRCRRVPEHSPSPPPHLQPRPGRSRSAPGCCFRGMSFPLPLLASSTAAPALVPAPGLTDAAEAFIRMLAAAGGARWRQKLVALAVGVGLDRWQVPRERLRLRRDAAPLRLCRPPPLRLLVISPASYKVTTTTTNPAATTCTTAAATCTAADAATSAPAPAPTATTVSADP